MTYDSSRASKILNVEANPNINELCLNTYWNPKLPCSFVIQTSPNIDTYK